MKAFLTTRVSVNRLVLLWFAGYACLASVWVYDLKVELRDSQAVMERRRLKNEELAGDLAQRFTDLAANHDKDVENLRAALAKEREVYKAAIDDQARELKANAVTIKHYQKWIKDIEKGTYQFKDGRWVEIGKGKVGED